MKSRYKHKTSVFGTDAEYYISRLFMMMKNPNGYRRPDLVSVDNRFDPRLSVEVKSGRQKKGILVDYQLHYAITSWEDYANLFGEKPLFKGELFNGETLISSQISGIAYYYNIVNRADEVRAKELDSPFSSIKLHWGDQYIVPHEYAFYSFAIARTLRTGEDIREVIEDLRKIMQNDALCSEGLDYKGRKDLQSWQNIQGKDVLAIFNDDVELTSKDGKKRIELLHKHYGDILKLKKILISGPNETSIYVLAYPEDYRLFDEQLRATVKERSQVIEEISRERQESLGLLRKIEETPSLFGVLNKDNPPSSKISIEQKIKLKRLTCWLAEGEFPLEIIPF